MTAVVTLMRSLLVAVFVIGAAVGQADDVCDNGICQCQRHAEGGLIVICNNGGLTAVPDRIPQDTHTLRLRSNALSSIDSNAFHTLSGLRRLQLADNNISRIAPAAFRNLHSLSLLDLDLNSLTDVSQVALGDLLEVETIKLNSNRLGHIEWTAFDFSQNLTEIQLDNNERVACNCELKYLRDWASARDPIVLLTDARCDGRDLVDVPDEDFGDCPDREYQRCWACDDQPSIPDCMKTGQWEMCETPEEICGTTVITRQENHNFTMGCQDKEYCVLDKMDNVDLCKQAANYQTCQFCCSGDNCATHILLEGYTYTMHSNLEFVLLREYNAELEDPSSEAYKELSAEITSGINPLLSAVGEMTYMGVLRYRRRGSNILSMSRLTSRIPMATDYIEIQQDLHQTLETAITTGDLQLPVETGSLAINGETTCSAQTLTTEKGEFRWPATRVGGVRTLACPVPKVGSDTPRAVRICIENENGTVAWEEPETEECAAQDDVTKELKDLVNTPITQETLPDMTRRLANLTGLGELTSEAVEYSVQVIDRIVYSGNATLSPTSTADVVTYFSNVMNVSVDTLANLERLQSTTTRILQSINQLAEVVDLQNETEILLVEKPIAMSFVAVNSEVTGAVFQTSPGVDGDLTTKNVRVKVNSTSAESPENTEASLTLPPSAFTGLRSNLTNLQFVVYDDSKFFTVLGNGNGQNGSTWMDEDKNTTGRKLNTRVIKAKFQGVKLIDLPEPVTIQLQHVDETYGANAECVFWEFDETYDAATMGWSPRGCEVVRQEEGKYTICHCDHLTSFAAIMDIYGNSGNIDEANKRALSIITYVGCSLSLAALLATIVTYSMFRKLRSDNPSKILMNLCCAMTGLLILFIICSQPVVRDSGAGCQAVAALLHYCLLSTWVWMAVEAFYMYLALVKVFKTYYSKFILKCCLIGWGVPALIVAITVAISRENYGKQGDLCWLSRNAFFGAALAPIGLILVLNFVAFGLVIHQLRTLSSGKLEKSRSSTKMDTQAQLRGAASVVILLGLTWIFAVFAIGEANLVFQYLFTILNSLQGLFIFIFYCVLKKDVAKMWKKKITGQMSSSHPSSSKGYTTSSTPMYGTNYKNEQNESPYARQNIGYSKTPSSVVNEDSWKTKL